MEVPVKEMESFLLKSSQNISLDKLIVIRGGGDLATGVIHKLYRCHFPVLILETEKPLAIRRNVSFSEAIYEGRKTVDGVEAFFASNIEEAKSFLEDGKLTIIVDPQGDSISILKPMVVIDAILAKKNLGTNKTMAKLVIGLGPGFEAGGDVDIVIETKRGHYLGKIIEEGYAIANTGIPGLVGGYDKERVIHSPDTGIIRHMVNITEQVKKGQVIGYIEKEDHRTPIYATIDGLIRGFIREGFQVKKGLKIADIDPRLDEYENCFTISDKARAIAGGVLEVILMKLGKELWEI